MKKLICNLLGNLVLIAAGALLLIVWFSELWLVNKILISITAFIFILIVSIPNEYDKPHENLGLFQSLIELDSEKDILKLRNIRTIVNRKIAKSNTNKALLKATKDVCGKNCKCTELRKSNACEQCGMYKAYVEYLLNNTEK